MKKQWKIRPIRMSDELWFELMKLAKIKRLSTAEFVRRLIEKGLIWKDSI